MQETIKKNDAFFRQMFFIAVLVAIALVLADQLRFFIGSFLGAITLYIVLRNILFRMVDRWRWPRWAAALILVVVIALALLGIGYFSFKVIASEIPAIDARGLLTKVEGLAGTLNQRMGFDLLPDHLIERSQGVISTLVSSVLNTTYSFAANIFMMLVILFFMLTAGRRMEHKMWEYAPFREQSLGLLRREAKHMIYSNAVGIPLVMVAQTIVSVLIYWLLGIDNSYFWGFLTALCGLVPLVGTTLVYVPMAVYLIVSGDVAGGIVLIAYGLLVISNTDNVFRIVLLKKVADTHPLIVIFGVILGIPLFGFWGIIFGPLFISGFLLLVRIYYMEYGLLQHPTDEELRRPPMKRVPKHITHITRVAAKAKVKRAERS